MKTNAEIKKEAEALEKQAWRDWNWCFVRQSVGASTLPQSRLNLPLVELPVTRLSLRGEQRDGVRFTSRRIESSLDEGGIEYRLCQDSFEVSSSLGIWERKQSSDEMASGDLSALLSEAYARTEEELLAEKLDGHFDELGLADTTEINRRRVALVEEAVESDRLPFNERVHLRRQIESAVDGRMEPGRLIAEAISAHRRRAEVVQQLSLFRGERLTLQNSIFEHA